MDAVLVNARYSGRPITGVERVATEIVRHLTVEHRLVGAGWGHGARGHMAEQIGPLLSGTRCSALLWSPANTGPVLHRNHVVTIHDVATIRHPEFFSLRFRAVYQRLLRALGQTARTVVTPSQFTARELVDLNLVEGRKIVVIRNGVDGVTSAPRAESSGTEFSSLNVPQEYLLTVGSMDPRKNMSRLVAAYERAGAASALPPLLVVGGSGRAFSELRTLQSTGVRFLGRVSDEVLARLYAGASGIVNVSVYEGFGLTVAEAARFNIPLLLSDIPPHREVLPGDTAVEWVDPRDVAAIGNALRRLAGADRCVHNVSGHTWADAGAAYGALFRSLDCAVQ